MIVGSFGLEMPLTFKPYTVTKGLEKCGIENTYHAFEIFRDKVSMHLLAARLETVLGMGAQFRFDGMAQYPA